MNGLCVVQHTESEFLGLMEDHFEARNIRFVYHRPFVPGAVLPTEAGVYSGLVLLGGGPRGVVSGDLLPSLAAELRLTRAFREAERPVIGIGLGAAILAIAAGGGAEPTPLRFVVSTARRVRADALGGHLPEHYPLVLYGRDRPLPPDAAEVLAVDSEGAPALYRVGANCLGFAGHPGTKRGMIEDLAMEFAETPEELLPGLQALSACQRELAEALSAIMVGVVGLAGLMQPQ